MLKELLIIILLTLTPFLELRASIPYGVFVGKLHWFTVLITAVIANILLGPIVYFILDRSVKQLLKIAAFERLWKGQIEKAQRKLKPMVDTYGEWGLAIFIGTPLPGTGVYSGAIGAYILGMGFKKFFLATIAGVLIAGIIVAAVVWSGSEALWFLIKTV